MKIVNKVKWTTNKTISIGRYHIPCSENIKEQSNQAIGIRRDSILKLLLRKIHWPLSKLKRDLFVDGFIERETGKRIKEFLTYKSVFLEVGCGDMSLKRFLPQNICYNAFDVSLLEFHLLRVLKTKKKKSNINIALASATEIPLESNTVSLIVSTECFEHIPEIDNAIKEIHRVAMPKAILICSIPNNYCYMYKKKGPHPKHVNNWSYNGFIEFMNSHGFEFLAGKMKGLWIPLPLWLTKVSYQLPISSDNEFYNTTFLYVFKVLK